MKYLVLLLLFSCSHGHNSNVKRSLEYKKAIKTYKVGDFTKSIKSYKTYLENCIQLTCKTEQKLFAIDMLGTIYIRHLNDPKSINSYLKSYIKRTQQNDAILDEIEDWISASNDYLELNKLAHTLTDSKTLFFKGNSFYKKGIAMKKYPMDRSGNPILSIASSYYLQLIYNHDNHKQIGTALFRMGVIRSTLWQEKEFWSQNHYLKETIRRFPKTKIAQQAYEVLKEEIHVSYSGSSGDSTPPSQITLLKYFKDIAYGKAKKTLKRKPLN